MATSLRGPMPTAAGEAVHFFIGGTETHSWDINVWRRDTEVERTEVVGSPRTPLVLFSTKLVIQLHRRIRARASERASLSATPASDG